MGRRRGVELYRAPFPLYALRVDPKTGLLIAAGGGGAAKTGIKNGVVRTLGTGRTVAGSDSGVAGECRGGPGVPPALDPARASGEPRVDARVLVSSEQSG